MDGTEGKNRSNSGRGLNSYNVSVLYCSWMKCSLFGYVHMFIPQDAV